jgi:hypothetical protein
MDAPPLFHVASRPIPAGQALRPYAVARRHPDLFRLADAALAADPDALRSLLAGAAWAALRQQGDHQAEMVLLEAVFERARRALAPHLPSRLEAVYLWGSLALAQRFRAEYRPAGLVHRCALLAGDGVARDGALVVAAYEAADLAAPAEADLRAVAERANRYWAAAATAPMGMAELLVRGTVVVEGIVDADSDGHAPPGTSPSPSTSVGRAVRVTP